MELLKQQVEYLRENGFNEQQANTLVHFHKDSIERSVATKRDIADVRKEIADVYKSVEQLRADTKKDLELLKRDMTVRLGSIMVAGLVTLSAIMKLL